GECVGGDPPARSGLLAGIGIPTRSVGTSMLHRSPWFPCSAWEPPVWRECRRSDPPALSWLLAVVGIPTRSVGTSMLHRPPWSPWFPRSAWEREVETNNALIPHFLHQPLPGFFPRPYRGHLPDNRISAVVPW